MGHTPETYRLTTVTCVLEDEVELAEALGFPEISALGDSERHWQAALQAKVKAILEDSGLSPAVSLHRRRITVEPVVGEVEVRLEASSRSPAWQEPVTLRLPVVRWVEAGELHQAYVPALGMLVYASRESLLEERVQAHVRLVLMGRRKKVGLRDLAQLARVESIKTATHELTATIPSPKAVAADSVGEKETTSQLATLAEELPPHVSIQVDGHQIKPAPSKSTAASPPTAFEMEAELANLAEALAGPHRRSVLLIGPAGCGKTALVRELARRRREFGFGHTPFWSTRGARLMTGSIGFGMWQERCQKLCREAAKTHSILHLGNLAELLEVGKAQRGQQSVGGYLQPWIARGEVLAISECTPEQVSIIERGDPHLLGAFVQLQIPARTPEQTRAILGRVFETAAGTVPETDVAASSAALERLHQLHCRYAIYSANPGRPVRFLKNLLADHVPVKSLTESEVTAAFSRETGLPPVLLDDRIQLDLEATRVWFAHRLIGQPEAVARVIDLLAIVKARLARPRKPLASFLFIGPTGTGKTELAKTLAEFLFGDSGRLARFDLNQFNDPVSLQRLIGGPLAGSAEGLLTARIREQPFSVVLLDEFEKADPAFFDLLLQILGDGRLTDAAGRVADFCNCVVVMTSNLGAQGFQRGPAGFHADGQTAPDSQQHFTDAVRQFLRPEIFNRLDAVVPFQPLPPDVVLDIARRQIEQLRLRDGLRLRPVELDVLPGVVENLARKCCDARYGARPLKRAIERELVAPLAAAMAEYSEHRAIRAQVGIEREWMHIGVRAKPEATDGDVRRLAPSETRDQKLLISARAGDELAEAIMAMRRRIARLSGCSAASELENQVTIGESLARRLAKAKWKSPEQQARLARLPKLRECLAAIGALQERARRLETEALTVLYQRQPLEAASFVPELDAVNDERVRLLREVFRLRLEEPDEVVMALFSEHRGTLLELAGAYYRLANEMGRVVALSYFVPPPGVRSGASRAIRQEPKKPDRPFESAPEKVVGVVMHLRGDLFFPRFESEAGLHSVNDKQGERFVLIETRRPPLVEYQPPEGVERRGGIRSKGAEVRRQFDREKETVEDLKLGERPWRGIALEQCLRALIEEALYGSVEALTS